MSPAATWLALAGLGAYHGLNPAMGWLFAVALGLQEERAGAVLRALPPIALGHAASIAIVIALVTAARLVVPPGVLRAVGAGVLALFGLLILARRILHPRWVAMRVGFRDLVGWSFLMSSAHGAGLMLVPLLLHLPDGRRHALGGHAHALPGTAATSGVAALLVHTTSMFLVMGLLALVVYRTVGVDLLRRVWVNLDLVWGGALLLAAAATLLLP
ncbi:MAG TPA: hypothetical protein VF832_21355 [Longimicrobiales bacterium]